MKILQLELQNINSIKTNTPVKINFTDDIFSSGLFAITGPTGAGKTTLLDAITIALYREIPRFNASHIKLGLTDIVSRGANEAMSRVTFSNEGEIYEAFWHLRIKTQNGRILTNPRETVRLINISKNKIIAETKKDYKKKIEEITHLNYEQFLRSMMLAQGEFAAFLKAGKNEKVALLDQIIGKEIYKKIGENVSIRIKNEKEELKKIESKINLENILTNKEKINFENEQKEILKKLNLLKTQTNKLQKINNYYQTLNQLQKENEKLKAEKEKFLQQKEIQKEISQSLSLHLKAEVFEKLLQKLINYEKEQKNKQKQYDQTVFALQQMLIKKTKWKKLLSDSLINLQKTQQEEIKWLPKLDKITRIETNLKNKKEQLILFENNFIELEKKIFIEEKILIEKENEKTKLKNQLKEITVYTQTHSDIQKIETKFNQWSILLNKRLDRKKEIKNLTIELIKLQKNKNKFIELINQDKKLYTKKTKELNEKKEQLNSLQQNLSLFNAQELNIKLQNNTELKEKLKNALKLIKEIEISQNQIIQHKEQVKKYKSLIEILKNDRKILKKEFNFNKELIKEIERQVELENKVKNLEEERNKLQEGKACPLCGSTQHPFVKKYQNYNFNKTQKRLNEKKKILDNTQNQLINKEKNISKIKIHIQNNEENIKIIHKKILLLKNEYKKLSNSFDKSIKLKQQLENINNSLKQIQDKIQKSTTLQNQYNQLNIIYQKETKEVTYLQEKLSINQTKLENLKTNINQYKLKQKENINKLNQLEIKLKNDFSTHNLNIPNYEQTNNFIQIIQQQIEKYNQQINLKEKLKNHLKILITQIKNTQKNLNEKNKNLKILKQNKISLNKNINQLTKERKSILPLHLSVQQKRKELQKIIEQTNKKHQQTKEKFIQIEKEISTLQSEEKKLSIEIKQLNELLKKLNLKLIKQLQNSIFNSRQEIEAALLSYTTKQKYLKLQKQIDNWQIALITKEKEINNKFKKISQKPKIEHKLAISQLNNLEEEKENLQKRLGSIDTLLKNDTKLWQQYKQIRIKIEQQKKIIEKWQTLFDLLGGTKDSFNIYVQRLTLQNLINHANYHLSRFTNRYALQPASLKNIEKINQKELNIELIDYHQAGNIRPVETCSGGETFLLSLSLALGLSDMASRNVKIESLFIDEGFGSLDDDLLETVISTLENLQSDGKVIGIISHVEKLKERIGTQIQIKKIGNGISQVKITT